MAGMVESGTTIMEELGEDAPFQREIGTNVDWSLYIDSPDSFLN